MFQNIWFICAELCIMPGAVNRNRATAYRRTGPETSEPTNAVDESTPNIMIAY
jgi:hypothetical protein